MIRRTLLILVCLGIVGTMAWGQEKILKMGYRTTEKLPFIKENPDNSGLFFDLYTEAARRMGFKLEIVRLPKARITQALEQGEVDFYPAYTFDEERAVTTFFFPNGLKQRETLVTRADIPDIKTLDQLKNLTGLISLGNPDYLAAAGYDTSGLKQQTVAELDVEKALLLIGAKRADYFAYDEETLRYLVKSKGITGLKFHDGLFKKYLWSFVGFSMKSKWFVSEANPNYDAKKALSPENFPRRLKKDSVAALLEKTLADMLKDGFTEKLHQKYFD